MILLSEKSSKLAFWGIYFRMSLFAFSIAPFCQEQYESAKYTLPFSRPPRLSIRVISRCAANSQPLSVVIVWTNSLYGKSSLATTFAVGRALRSDAGFSHFNRALLPTPQKLDRKASRKENRRLSRDRRRFSFLEAFLSSFWGVGSKALLKCEKPASDRKALPTAKVVARLLFPYREFVHTITTDNGCEFAAHLEITRMLSRGGREKGKVYFADSYCSWQKGAIENANKLIRKYIPQKANFDDFSDSKIMKIQKKNQPQTERENKLRLPER